MTGKPEFRCSARTIAIQGPNGTNFLRICAKCEGSEPSQILANGPGASTRPAMQAFIWNEGMAEECVKEQERRARRKKKS